MTANGDLANASVGSPILDFFSGVCRNDKKLDEAMETRIAELMPQCWAEDPLLTLRLLFYKRDCREGAGERRIFELGYRWLLDNYPAHAVANLDNIPEYGSYKDWEKLLDHPVARIPIVQKFATQIIKDSVATNQLTLAAKWAPSLGGSTDKRLQVCREIASAMGYRHNWQQLYRKTLHGVREKLQVVEVLMSSADWKKIDFSKVPSLAMLRYRKIFQRHTPEEWTAYITALKSGKDKKVKVNSRQLMPHELVNSENLNHELTQFQWTALVEATRARGTLRNAIAMCDVSGSMSGLPMDVSIAIGCLVSELCESSLFKDQVITFTETPRFFDLSNKTLQEKVAALSRTVGYNTNLSEAFRVILERAKAARIPENQMPEKIILISDMQFDAADTTYGVNSFNAMKTMYREAGYRIPEVVFWNVQGLSKSFPVTADDQGVCMVSGFSQNILNQILGAPVKNPMQVMQDTLNGERYQQVKLASFADQMNFS